MSRLLLSAVFAAIILVCSQLRADLIAEFGFIDVNAWTGWPMDPGIATVSSIYTSEPLWPYPAPTGDVNGRDFYGFDGDGTASFVSVSINPQAGYKVNYTDFSISFHDPGNGTGRIYLRSSADNYASNYLASNTYAGNSADYYLTFDLSGISALQNRPDQTTFRVYFTPIGTGDMVRVQNNPPTQSIYEEPYWSTHAIAVGGAVQAVPEPGAMPVMALVLVGGAGVGYVRRRKNRRGV